MAYERGSGQTASKTTPLAALISGKKKTTEDFDQAMRDYVAFYRGDSTQKTNARKTTANKTVVRTGDPYFDNTVQPTVHNRANSARSGDPYFDSARPAGTNMRAPSTRSASRTPAPSTQSKARAQPKTNDARPPRSGGSGSTTTRQKTYSDSPQAYRPPNPAVPASPQANTLRSSAEVFGDAPNPWADSLRARSMWRRHATRLPSPVEPPNYPDRPPVWRPSRMGQPESLAGPMSVPAAPAPPIRQAFREGNRPMAQPQPMVQRPQSPRVGRTMREEIQEYVRSQVYLPVAPMGRWR